MQKAGKSNWLCKTEGVSWIYDTPSVFYPFFKILRSLSDVFYDNVLAVEYASSSQRDNYPSTRLSGIGDVVAIAAILSAIDIHPNVFPVSSYVTHVIFYLSKKLTTSGISLFKKSYQS